MRTSHPIIAALLALLMPRDAYCVRQIYFVGNATSNFSIDLTSFWAAGNTTSTGAYTFSVADFGCRVFLYNPPGGTPQRVEASTILDQSLEYPAPGASWSMGNMTPLTYNSGSPMVHSQQATTLTSVRVFTVTAGTPSTSVALPRTLAANQGLILENLNTLSATVNYLNGWLTGTPGIYPFAKLHHVCTGRIDVSDATAGSPGALIASAQQDYLSSSYQQYPLSIGGTVTRGDASDSTSWPADAGNLTSNGAMTVAGFGAMIFSNNDSDCSSYPMTNSCTKVFARAKGNCWWNCDCTVDIKVDNTRGRSSFMPARLYKQAIVVNGGSPI